MSSSRAKVVASGPLLSQEDIALLLRQSDRHVRRVVVAVKRHIGRFDRAAGGRSQQLLPLAVKSATAYVIESLGPEPKQFAGVADLYGRMGHSEAAEGHQLVEIWGALAIAQIETSHWITLMLGRGGHTAAQAGQVSERVRRVVAMLAREISRGYEIGMAHHAARHLYRALEEGSVDAIDRHRAVMGWTPDPAMVVVRARAAAPVVWPSPARTPADADDTQACFVVGLVDQDHLVAQLVGLPGVRVAVSWPVSIEHLGDAAGRTRAAFDLAERGIIPRRDVIYCADHRIDLWISTDEALRVEATEAVLGPLLAESTASRSVLAETLLLWLQTRDSAPSLGVLLGVHPQTVRYRWKRLTDMFGERLADPEGSTELLLALRAVLPVWRAGASQRGSAGLPVGRQRGSVRGTHLV